MATSPQSIVDQLLSLSADPENQAYIVRESGCLSGLVGYLSYPDANVVHTAAKAIWHLSSGSANREAVKTHPGLFAKLQELRGSTDTRVQSVVKQTIENLTPAVKPVVVESSYGENTAPNPVAPARVARGARTAKPARARPIKMKVEGIAQEYWRSTVERALIRVPGVISVTLDKRREEAIVYTKHNDGMLSKLVRAVSNLGMEATPLDGAARTPVVPAPAVPKKAAPTGAAMPTPLSMFRTPFASVQAQAPSYLDEEDENSYFGVGVMTRNIGNSSLEARLAAKRKEEAEKRTARTGGKRAAVASMFGRLGSTFGLW